MDSTILTRGAGSSAEKDPPALKDLQSRCEGYDPG